MTTQDYAYLADFSWRCFRTWDGFYRRAHDPQEAIKFRNQSRYFRRCAKRWEQRLQNAQRSKDEAIA
ncbi:hypothetical protein [Leptolyngbya sp. FACHB-16]|uniref:hypothetical protein n=1 Tax=unclassified Leptolyngbya TaxID=2650499 RepID=UPI0016836D0C|nr:hypothetical protein [Leptolyngbya sp. FACHB-16]MBD2156253.1 hypothetical protein [Leptolyngbya sp. FACHB-16]